MSVSISKSEYLKRYLEANKEKKRTKKKNNSRIKIVDTNINLKTIKFDGKDTEENEDENPTVAEVIDDRPIEVKLKDLYKSSRWKKFGAESDLNSITSCISEDQNQAHSITQGMRRRHDSASDNSPPQMQIADITSMKHESDSDMSPPRNQSAFDSKNSLHKRKTADDKQRKSYDIKGASKRLDSDSDLSPDRQSVSRVRNSFSKRYKNRKSSNKPKELTGNKSNSDSDLSPVRKKPNVRNDSDSDLSPPRREEKSNIDNSGRPKKTLSGLHAGLQNASALKSEIQELREREKLHISQMNKELSGRDAAPILRDRQTGKKRNLEEEALLEHEKEKKQSERKKQYNVWGKGIEQTDDRKNRIVDDLYEMSKPLARYCDDEDLDEELKDRIHDEDPMAAYMRKKKQRNLASAMPEYKGPPAPPNRFGIKPGYRWDGVDRSNGFETRYFNKCSNTKAVAEESYLWSIQDM